MATQTPVPEVKDPPPQNRWNRGQRRGLLLAAAVIIIALVVLIIGYGQSIFTSNTARTWIVLAGAFAVLVGANRAVFSPAPGNNDAAFVRYVIAYNAVIFIVIGLATLIIACKDWMTPVLMAGGTLLIGGFFGLLFGYPSGVVQQTKSATPQGTTSAQDKNLLAESASTLGKIIAGFTLAKSGDLVHYTSRLCHTIAPAFGPDNSTNHLMALAMLVYFLSTGFLSGLLLPSYFMAGVFAAPQANPTLTST